MNKKFNSLSIGAIRCVNEVVKTRNLTEAARNLNISQPAASQYLSRVEKILGFPILIRKGNELIIRSEDAAAALKDITIGIGELEQISAGSVTGVKKIRVGISKTLVDFSSNNLSKIYEICNNFDLCFAAGEHLKEEFTKGQLDCCIRIISNEERGFESMFEFPVIWVSGKKKLSGGGEIKNNAVLPVILGSKQSIYSRNLENNLRNHGVNYKILVRSESTRLTEKMLIEGLGAVALPDFGAHDIIKKNNVSVISSLPGSIMTIGLTYQKKSISYLEAVSIFEIVVEFISKPRSL